MISNIKRYLSETKNELKKVSWLSRQEIGAHTLLVIIVSLVVAIFIGLVDYILSLGAERLFTGL